jgi:hypothetical protein
MDINESVKSAYEHGLQAANGTQTDEEKSAIATILDSLRSMFSRPATVPMATNIFSAAITLIPRLLLWMVMRLIQWQL